EIMTSADISEATKDSLRQAAGTPQLSREAARLLRTGDGQHNGKWYNDMYGNELRAIAQEGGSNAGKPPRATRGAAPGGSIPPSGGLSVAGGPGVGGGLGTPGGGTAAAGTASAASRSPGPPPAFLSPAGQRTWTDMYNARNGIGPAYRS